MVVISYLTHTTDKGNDGMKDKLYEVQELFLQQSMTDGSIEFYNRRAVRNLHRDKIKGTVAREVRV